MPRGVVLHSRSRLELGEQWLRPHDWVVAVLEGVGYRLEGKDCDRTEDFGARLVVVGRLRPTQRSNLCRLGEVARRPCRLVKAYESGAHVEPNWNSVKLSTREHSSSNIAPVPMRRFRPQEGEGGDLCATKTAPVFEDGEWEYLSAPHLFVSLKSKGKGKGRGSSQLLRPRHERQIGQC